MHKEAQAEPRTCYRCQRARPLTEFYVEAEKRRAATLGRRTFTYPCRSCQSELAAERMAPRRAIVDAARDVGCTDCGLIDLEHPEIFDFDHLDGTTKAGNVAAFLSKGTLDDLRAELIQLCVKEIGPIAKPKDIRFGDNLPKTRSGKIMRRLLRGLAKGEELTQDTSTLENPAILEQLKG